ncbi:MAG: FAD-dependent oxidoreductase [bacterium]
MKSLSCPVRAARDLIAETLSSRTAPDGELRDGLARLLRFLEDVAQGAASPERSEPARRLASDLSSRTIDRPGWHDAVAAASRVFAHEDVLRSHLEDHLCPAGECTTLVPAPCRSACPAGVDVPAYVALTGLRRYGDALEVLREDLPLPGVLGRVCVRPCETACARTSLDAPIAICRLKRVAFDEASREGDAPGRPPRRGFAEKVAVVGSGPAGLSAAYFLARRGYRPVIFESMPEPGGMLRWTIPAYRLPRHVLRRDIDFILAQGVRIRTGLALGRDITLESLRDRGYAAFFLGLGAWSGRPLRVAGEDSPAVVDGLTFLRHGSLGPAQAGARVVVVGGGNAAIDCARTALRLGGGAVQVVYRRAREQMPAHREEVEAAEQEGVHISFLSSPIRIRTAEGRLAGLECIRNELCEPDGTGRRRPVAVAGSEFFIPADMVIRAIGQTPDRASVEAVPGLELTRSGLVAVRPETMETSLPGVFAGGDVVSGPASVIEAVAAGKSAAEAIHRYLRRLPRPAFGLLPGTRRQVPPLRTSAQEREYPLPPRLLRIGIDRRRQSFDEVDLRLTAGDAAREATRCLRCDVCIRCGRCVEVCRDSLGIDALHLFRIMQDPQDEAGARGITAAKLDFSRAAERCIGCAACAESCPTGALTVEEANGRRTLRHCGAEVSRNRLVRCAGCGAPFATERQLLFISERESSRIRPVAPRAFCPACARGSTARDLAGGWCECRWEQGQGI